MAAVSGNQDKLPPGIICFFSAQMTAGDQGWPTWSKGLGNYGGACVGVTGLGFQQAQNEHFSLPQERHGYEALCPVPGFITRTTFRSRKERLPPAFKDPQIRQVSSPDRLQVNGKAINSCLLQTVVGQQRKVEIRKGGSVRNLCWIIVSHIRTAASYAASATEAVPILVVGPNFYDLH